MEVPIPCYLLSLIPAETKDLKPKLAEFKKYLRLGTRLKLVAEFPNKC